MYAFELYFVWQVLAGAETIQKKKNWFIRNKLKGIQHQDYEDWPE
jgi:hypothetical protein